MLMNTIHFYHFIPLSLILTLPRGHKVSAKEKLLASFFFINFSTDQDEIKLNILKLLLSEMK